MLISFLICTYNRADSLKKMIDNLLSSIEFAGLGFSVQIIIINNNSTDHTRQAIEQIHARLKGHPYVTIVHDLETMQGKGHALMRGFEYVEGDYVCFLDDDNLFFDSTYKILVQEIHNNPKALIGSHNIVDPKLKLPVWFQQFEYNYACGEQTAYLKDQGAIWGAGMVVPFPILKKILDAGFSFILNCREGEKLSSGSDTELSFLFRYLGLEVILPTNYKLIHMVEEKRINIRYLIKLYFGFGVATPYLALYEQKINLPPSNNLAIYNLNILTHLKNILRQIFKFNLKDFYPVIYRFGVLYCLYFKRKELKKAQLKIDQLFLKL